MPRPGHVHKEAEIAGVGDQGRIVFAPAGFELGLEKGKEFDILAVAFGVGGVALGFGNVEGDFLEQGQGRAGCVKERAVNQQVGVAADGGGEMGVFGLAQSVMAQRFDGVTGAHEGFEEADLQGRADGQGVEAAHKFLDLAALGEVAAGDLVAENVLAVFLQTAFFGRLMDAIDGGAAQGHQPGGHGFVGQEHEFLDQLVGDVVFDAFDARGGGPARQGGFWSRENRGRASRP